MFSKTLALVILFFLMLNIVFENESCPSDVVIFYKIIKINYVKEKVDKWIEDLEELAKLAVDEPQIALSAYTKGLCHR